MAMTEKQGGSDVRANTTRAVRRSGGDYLLTGHKWFCSAPMSDAFLVLAQVATARTRMRCPAFWCRGCCEDGTRNVFRIQRLKDKLGNRSNASCEVEFDGTVGHLVGEVGAGVRTIIEMVARTRLDCVYGSAAGMRQGVAEALWHVRHRAAFGALLMDQPAMTAVVADLALESEAATATAHAPGPRPRRRRRRQTRRASAASPQRWPSTGSASAGRTTPTRRWSASAATATSRLPAGPPLPRAAGDGDLGGLRQRHRPGRAAGDAPRAGRASQAFDAEVSLAGGAHPAARRAHRQDVANWRARSAASDPRPPLAWRAGWWGRWHWRCRHRCSCARHPPAVSETFIAARLGEDRSGEYGSLPRGSDVAAILDRHAN